MVHYDGTVRDSVGQLIQLRYGEDGLCGEAVEFQNIATIDSSHEKFENEFKFDISNKKHLKKLFTENVLREMVSSNNTMAELLQKEWQQLVADRRTLREIFPAGESKVVLPCNLKRMIWNVQKIFHIKKQTPSDLNPMKVISGKL